MYMCVYVCVCYSASARFACGNIAKKTKIKQIRYVFARTHVRTHTRLFF